MKCQICMQRFDSLRSWQPFGPDENPKAGFYFPGGHFRGFPVIKVCDTCKVAIKRGDPVNFIYRKVTYVYDSSKAQYPITA